MHNSRSTDIGTKIKERNAAIAWVRQEPDQPTNWQVFCLQIKSGKSKYTIWLLLVAIAV